MWILKIVWEDTQRTYTADDALAVMQLIVAHIADSGLIKMKLRWEP